MCGRSLRTTLTLPLPSVVTFKSKAFIKKKLLKNRNFVL